jgi:hypothetical protein
MTCENKILPCRCHVARCSTRTTSKVIGDIPNRMHEAADASEIGLKMMRHADLANGTPPHRRVGTTLGGEAVEFSDELLAGDAALVWFHPSPMAASGTETRWYRKRYIQTEYPAADGLGLIARHLTAAVSSSAGAAPGRSPDRRT